MDSPIMKQTKKKLDDLIRFRNCVDMHKLNRGNPKVFGENVWPLIMCGTISPVLLQQMKEYFEDEIIAPGIPYDADDYHLHLSLLYFSQNQYIDALNEMEKVDGANLYNGLSKFNTYKAFVDCALKNFSPSNLCPMSCPLNVLSMDKEVLVMLFKWQNSYRFMNDINSCDTAYFECLNALHYSGKVFESKLKQLRDRKEPAATGKTINDMLQNIASHYPGIDRFSLEMNNPATSISFAKEPSELRRDISAFESRISTYSSVYEKFGGLMFLCRVIRNNSSHEHALFDKMFENELEYKKYISILHEGILVVNSIP